MVKEILIESVKHISSARLPYFYGSTKHFSMYLDSMQKFELLKAVFHFLGFLRLTALYSMPIIIIPITVFCLKKNKSNEKFIVLLFLIWDILSLPKSIRGDVSHLIFSTTQIFVPLIFFVKKSDKKLKNFLVIILIFILFSIPFFFLKKISNLISYHYKIFTNHVHIILKDKNFA